MNKKQHILKHKQLFFNRTISDKEDLMIFPLKFKLSWHKQQMMLTNMLYITISTRCTMLFLDENDKSVTFYYCNV